MIIDIMTKRLVTAGIFCLMLLFSCKREESDTQNIHQILHLYLTDSAREDLLDTEKTAAYSSILYYDLNGETDFTPVAGFSKNQDANGKNFLEYISGAKRVPEKGSTDLLSSEVLFRLVRKINDSLNVTDDDTLKIFYRNQPQLFHIEKVHYNGKTQPLQNEAAIYTTTIKK